MGRSATESLPGQRSGNGYYDAAAQNDPGTHDWPLHFRGFCLSVIQYLPHEPCLDGLRGNRQSRSPPSGSRRRGFYRYRVPEFEARWGR
jgi:hypothetical protein